MNTTDHLAQTRPWNFGLDFLRNQGQFDTPLPSHALDPDCIANACQQPRRPTLHQPAPAYALTASHIAPMPRAVPERRRRDWVDVAWWIAERTPAAIVIVLAFLLALALYRAGGPA